MAPKPASRAPNVGAQATAVFTGSFLAGAMACLSAVVIPVFLDTDTESIHLLHHWVRLYHYGHIYMPAVCVSTCGLYGYAAVSQRKQWLNYTVASATTFAMVPFTWIMMTSTNNTLFRLEELATASTSMTDLSTVQGLAARWAWLHAARTLFPLVGAIMGFTSILQEFSLSGRSA